VGRSCVSGQSGPHTKFQDSLGYVASLRVKKTKVYIWTGVVCYDNNPRT
jgi:hypothetical protein